MIYIFAGFPPTMPDAGVLRRWVLDNGIGMLEEDSAVQYRKEGRFIVSRNGEEFAGPVEAVFSPSLHAIGLTLDIFDDGYCFRDAQTFGNSVVVNARTGMARPLTLLAPHRPVVHDPMKGRTVDFREPKWSRTIWLTWLVFQHRLPDFAYRKLLMVVEAPTDEELARMEQSPLWNVAARSRSPDGSVAGHPTINHPALRGDGLAMMRQA